METFIVSGAPAAHHVSKDTSSRRGIEHFFRDQGRGYVKGTEMTMFNVKREDQGALLLESHLLDLLATLPDALLVINDNGTILYANTTATTSVGVTKQEILNQTLWQCFPHLVALEFYQALIKALHAREKP